MPKRPPKKSRGRPTKFKPEYKEQAKKICSMGGVDKDLAEFFKVTMSTLYLWKQEHKDFSDTIKNTKSEKDSQVERSLYERATGYSHPDVHISNYQGIITETKLTKHYPPDPTSMIFWLKNRKPDTWREKQEVEHSGVVEHKHGLSEELQNLLDETYK
jgi:hypothetical protein